MTPSGTVHPSPLRWVLLFVLGFPAICGAEKETNPLDLSYVVLPLEYPVQGLTQDVQDVKGKGDALEGEGSKLAANTAAMEVKETETEVKINLLGDILFDYDKATIRAVAEPTLAQVVQMIQKYTKPNVLIEGYTDSKGSESYNAKLSERRAASVKTWLVSKGISEQLVRTKGLGAAHPVAPNNKPDGADNPDGRQKNRRVEITIKK